MIKEGDKVVIEWSDSREEGTVKKAVRIAGWILVLQKDEADPNSLFYYSEREHGGKIVSVNGKAVE